MTKKEGGDAAIDAALDIIEKAATDAEERKREQGVASDDTVPLSESDPRIGELESEVAEMRDKLLRALADGENARRRALRDRRDAEAFGGTQLARDLLSVYDNLERALTAADDDLRDRAKDFIAGVELTRKELMHAFSKHKIAPITPVLGDRFDPNLHQAMFEAPAPGAAVGDIIQIMQIGFTISERLLRPALVGIAKAAPEAEVEPGAGMSGAPGA